ncbi:galactose-specific lectin nattectin-like [Epinephelus fuscoguttatus]|uniref:galactose-specific lectin nattectin-like n=1 Tax=Epinephelus fuscoguttatus TaxID=293821 RepID=UPI0020D0D3EC|nr:galactose-specific lectin nattectin-like [Epinephelus fuscoguttatus]
MASSLHLIAVLCLTSGLWIGNADCRPDVGWCHCDQCPDGWTRFGDNCYQFHHEHKTWADAEFDCIAHQGNLASIHGQKEYDFVKHLIHEDSGKDERTWVGGHDMAKEGVWMWSDGSPFDLEGLWGEGEPNNAGHGEHCLEMNYKGHPNDVNCNGKKAYVCEKPL